MITCVPWFVISAQLNVKEDPSSKISAGLFLIFLDSLSSSVLNYIVSTFTCPRSVDM